jgi:hypothetical protein
LRRVVELLKTPAFLEKVVLLLITAALTGVLVPAIAGWLSEARFREQKVFEAELQRQRDILSAQSELLKSLSKLSWEFQLMNIDVSFYKLNKNKIAYSRAVEKYQSKAGEILGLIRAEMSTSRRLVSPFMQQKLSKLYFETLLPIDASIEQLIQKGDAKQAEWNRQHNASFVDAQKQIDDVLTELAVELKLAAPASRAKGNSSLQR